MMQELPDGCIDLTITSPPYDDLRTYNGFTLDWHKVIEQLYRVTKAGGVVVWVVADATVNGSETGTSFKQALWAMECGFNLHDTMIYQKIGNGAPQTKPYLRYSPAFEYMFVFSKGRPKTFNPTMVYGSEKGIRIKGKRQKSGKITRGFYNAGAGSPEQNIWQIKPDHMRTGGRTMSSQHVAAFPETLARKHIVSWSSEGDLVLDPFMGSGTVAKMAMQNGRDYLGFDISEEYVELAKKRVAWSNPPLLVAS